MKTHSVLVHWDGPSPFNDTMDAFPNLTKKEAKIIANMYCSHQYSNTVDIINYDSGKRICERVT